MLYCFRILKNFVLIRRTLLCFDPNIQDLS